MLPKAMPRGALTAGVAVLVAVAVAAAGLKMLGGEAADEETGLPLRFQHTADSIAREVAVTLEPYAAALMGIAAEPRVSEVLRAGDAVQMAGAATALQPLLEGVFRLRVLPRNIRDPDSTSKPPLTFASISMLRGARESGEDPPAEVHLGGGEDEHIVMVKRVLDTTPEPPELLGFVHMSVDPDVLRAAFTALPATDAYVALQQGPTISLAAKGHKPTGAAPSAIAKVAGSKLFVSLQVAGELVAGDSGSSGGLASLVALVLTVVAGVAGAGWYFLVYRGTGVVIRPIRGEMVIYQGAIKAILDGSHPGLEQLLPGAIKTENTDVTPIHERADGDDVTQFRATEAVAPAEDPTLPRSEDVDGAPPQALDPAADPPPASIFRSYDIRGIVDDTLTADGVYQIGRALGAEADARSQQTVIVARDARHSSEALKDALTAGLLESGRDVLDIGLTPTPVLYFATHYLDAHSGVMITGSHNPPEYNGLKIVLDGETLSGEAIQAIHRRIQERDYIEGTGSLQATEIVPDYIRRISQEIPVTLGNALKVVVDCGNGVPGIVAPHILRAIGHDVIELYCDLDGDFPNHHPDPSQPENLAALIDAVAEEGADLGLAFDGDGDRLGVVDNAGNVIWPDRQMILFSRDILSRNSGAKIIYDVKCSRLLGAEISAHGGEPIMAKTGHSLIKAKMQETGALLAGEMSGHIFFKERWYGFDDALYSAARLLEILINANESPAEVFAALPGGVATPELRIELPEERHQEVMGQIMANANFADGEISTVDGLRVDFSDSWGLVRPSNTTPCLVLRFEGDDDSALDVVKTRFRELIAGVDAGLSIPF